MTKKKRNYIAVSPGSPGKARVFDLEFSIGLYPESICIIPTSIALDSLMYLLNRYTKEVGSYDFAYEIDSFGSYD